MPGFLLLLLYHHNEIDEVNEDQSYPLVKCSAECPEIQWIWELQQHDQGSAGPTGIEFLRAFELRLWALR